MILNEILFLFYDDKTDITEKIERKNFFFEK